MRRAVEEGIAPDRRGRPRRARVSSTFPVSLTRPSSSSCSSRSTTRICTDSHFVARGARRPAPDRRSATSSSSTTSAGSTDYLMSMAEEHAVPVVQSYNLDTTLVEVIDLVVTEAVRNVPEANEPSDLPVVGGLTAPAQRQRPNHRETRYPMSVEASALERSKLEQKDRAELSAIVDGDGRQGRLAGEEGRSGRSGPAAGRRRSFRCRRPAGADDGASACPRPRRPRQRRIGGGPGRGRGRQRPTRLRPPRSRSRQRSRRRSRAGRRTPVQEVLTPETVPTPASVDDPPTRWASHRHRSTITESAAPRRREPATVTTATATTADRDKASRASRVKVRASRARQGQQGQQGQPVDGDPGNRRRRRRGRRDRDRPDRDQQQPRTRSSRASRSTSRVISTCATTATASCASRASSRARTTCTSRSSRCASSVCARATTSRAPAGPPSRNEKNPALLRIDLVNAMDPGGGPQPAQVRGPHPVCSPTRSCAWSARASPTT